MIEKKRVYEDLVRILKSNLDDIEAPIEPGSDIRVDLDFDSLQLYGFVVDVEEYYGISIPDDKLDNVKTMDDLVTMVYEICTGNQQS